MPLTDRLTHDEHARAAALVPRVRREARRQRFRRRLTSGAIAVLVAAAAVTVVVPHLRAGDSPASARRINTLAPTQQEATPPAVLLDLTYIRIVPAGGSSYVLADRPCGAHQTCAALYRLNAATDALVRTGLPPGIPSTTSPRAVADEDVGLLFATPTVGYAAVFLYNRTLLYMTVDGGRVWTKFALPDGQSFYKWTTGGGHLYVLAAPGSNAVCPSGCDLDRFTPGAANILGQPQRLPGVIIDPTPHAPDVSLTAAGQTVWVTSDGDAPFVSTDSGMTFRFSGGTGLPDVTCTYSGVSSSTVWANCGTPDLWRSTDHGTTFLAADGVGGGSEFDLVDPNTVYWTDAANIDREDHTLHRGNGGPGTPRAVTLPLAPFTDPGISIGFSTPTIGLIGEEPNSEKETTAIYATSDAGQFWQPVTIATPSAKGESRRRPARTMTGLPGCNSSTVTFELVQRAAAGGEASVYIRVDHRGSDPCTVDGYPLVTVETSGAAPVDVTDGGNPVMHSPTPQRVTLKKGSNVFFGIGWYNKPQLSSTKKVPVSCAIIRAFRLSFFTGGPSTLLRVNGQVCMPRTTSPPLFVAVSAILPGSKFVDAHL